MFKKKNLISVVLCGLLLLLLSGLIPSFRPVAINTIRYPLYLSRLIGREIGGVLFYHRNLIQNEKLIKESQLLRQKINMLAEMQAENIRLKRLLSFRQRSPYKLTVARVIGRCADSWSSAVIIDKGVYHGIKRNMAVINYLGVVGRVIETSASTSKVILLSDPSLGISGMVQRSRQEGLVSGTLGSYLIMRYLPEEADIKVSDTIITSGLSDSYPKGLLIGKVIEIGAEFSGLRRYAIIRPAANLSNIEEVLVVTQ